MLIGRYDIDKNGCYIWNGAVTSAGYGNLKIENKYWLAHRFSYFLTHPNVDINDKYVLHKCDIKKCINPNHLFVGTQQDNMTDCVNKDRHTLGERHPNAKINENDVRRIRKLYNYGISQRNIGRQYDLAQPTISNIITGKLWSHVDKGVVL